MEFTSFPQQNAVSLLNSLEFKIYFYLHYLYKQFILSFYPLKVFHTFLELKISIMYIINFLNFFINSGNLKAVVFFLHKVQRMQYFFIKNFSVCITEINGV